MLRFFFAVKALGCRFRLMVFRTNLPVESDNKTRLEARTKKPKPKRQGSRGNPGKKRPR